MDDSRRSVFSVPQVGALRSAVAQMLVPLGRAARSAVFLAFIGFLSLFCPALPAAETPGDAARPRRVIVLGIDGMDHGLTRSLIESGDLPALAALARSGTFLPLETTMPPLSPVAWSTFMTGTNPGEHGVYDFLCRDPAMPGEQMVPLDAVTWLRSSGDPWPIPATGYAWPPSRQVGLRRNGMTLWEVLTEAGVPATIYKCPANFPVPESKAQVVAGMGTPDAEGSYGTFTYLTEDLQDLAKKVSGGRLVPVEVQAGKAQPTSGPGASQGLVLFGPEKPLVSAATGREKATVAFEVWVDRRQDSAAILLPGKQVVLRRGEWSRWQDVEFSVLPGLKSIHGLVRFYLKETAPRLRLYVSPVNLAPGTAGLASGGLDRQLAEAMGPYSTKGMPEETKGYTQGILSTDEYLVQSDLVLDESRQAFDLLLDRCDRGLLFLYVSTLDLGCHVLWKHDDAQHPAHGSAGGKLAPHPPDPPHLLRHLYRQMDTVAARVVSKLGPGDVLYVISDHGFGPMYRQFSLNDWLCQEGYLVLKEADSGRRGKTFADVDWKRTRAYALGFQGLYLNLRGREVSGIVPPEDRARLAEEIRTKLLGIEDAPRRSKVFHAVYPSAELYHGSRLSEAPDLIVGYESGYGPADESVLGELAGAVLSDNLRGFSGQHVTDWRLVPGVLFSNQRLADQPARLMDMTTTVLHDFGVAAASSMEGNVLKAGR